MRYSAVLSMIGVCIAAAGLAVGEPNSDRNERAPQVRLGAQRYQTFISTDKPIYRSGENVYVRGVILDAKRHTPIAADDRQPQAYIELFGPKGDRVAGGYAAVADSVTSFAWRVPDGQAGGPHSIKISYSDARFAPAERTFDVRAYRAPRLKTQIVFLRDGYGPGDEVVATVHIDRAEGGAALGANVTAIARVDGEEIFRGPATIDPQGNARVRFALPQKIKRGEGSLTFVIEDRGVVESAAKTIPILLQTVDLSIFPEGGDLVADIPTRVYLQAYAPTGKPADIAGVVLDQRGNVVSNFRTEHEGRGRFAFTPRGDDRYTLKITEPSGVDTTYPLPAIKSHGAVIQTDGDVFGANQPVRVTVAATEAAVLTVTLSKRETEIAAARIRPTPRAPVTVELTPPQWADGVLVATVWDAKGAPLAERLLFRKPAKDVQVEIVADKTQYVPGESVELTIRTLNENGEPISAVAGVAVTDDTVLEMIEKREQSPRLPVMVLLEQETRELADAHVYLDPNNQEAPRALDLLLGTQGWRRFAFVAPGRFLAQFDDDARYVLALGDPQVAQRFREVRRGIRDREVFKANERPELEGVVDVLFAAPADNAPLPSAAPPVAIERLAALGYVDVKDEIAMERDDMIREQAAGGRFVAQQEMMLADKAMSKRLPSSMIAVRQYAHAVRSDRQPNQRSDFSETVYWNAAVRTDQATGEAKVNFALSDSVTSFRAIADAFDANGRMGVSEKLIESVEPFYVEPKWPLEVTTGDSIILPVGLINNLDDALDTALSITTGSGLAAGELPDILVDAGGHHRLFAPIEVGDASGDTSLTLTATAGQYHDQVTRTISIKPLGFPTQSAFGGMLSADHPAKHKIIIPQSVVPNSVTSTLAVYPTPLANMTEALERLIREPHGCFEQTSSTNYPLVMAQQYFLSHSGVDPSLIARSRSNLEKGYEKLTAFECQKRGYEWFGADPGHEALTAFGLLEFVDMAGVMNVDAQMIDRTRKWLLDRRDGKGGFTRERRALHTWIEDRDCSNAYILWALLETDASATMISELSKEIAALKASAMQSQNSYVWALASNALRLAGDTQAADALAAKLADRQHADGWVDGATASIVGSQGEALRIEATALAVLAWMADAQRAGQVQKAIRYLATACEGGRYGSTQSTVLALRAIVAYDKARSRPKAAGSIEVLVDGKQVGDPVSFDGTTHGAIELSDIASALTPGSHEIELIMTSGAEMPYSVAIEFNSTQPQSSPDCKLDVSVTLADATMNEGESSEVSVKITNKSEDAAPTPVAIVGLPGGLQPRHDQLKELVKSGKIAAYEVLGREVVLYWRGINGGQSIEVPIEVTAAVPGQYTGPASRAYLYYTDEAKQWAPPIKVRINHDSKKVAKL